MPQQAIAEIRRPGPPSFLRSFLRQNSPSEALGVLQARMFVLSWLSYAGYYLTRKDFSVVKSRLHDELGVDTVALAGIDTIYLCAYAAGQFLSGVLGDRVGPRRMLGWGMLASAAAALCFGASSMVVLFGVAFGVNGLCQSTGWPNNVKIMGNWFSSGSRGKIMGLWSTNYQVGGLVATALAAYLLQHYGWRAAFRIPALVVAALGAAILVFLVERPQDVGLPAQDAPKSPVTGAAKADGPPLGLGEILRMPAIWGLGGAYFGLKLIRYSLLFWLPYYLSQRLHYPEDQAGYLSTAFEAGGILGAISIGALSDRYFAGRRVRLAAPVVLALAGAMILYQRVGGAGLVPNALSLGLIGFLLFGPDTLLSGAAAQDLGGSRATGSVAGVINGLGSIGAVLQGAVTVTVSRLLGWDALFYVFFGVAIASALCLVPLARAPAQRPV